MAARAWPGRVSSYRCEMKLPKGLTMSIWYQIVAEPKLLTISGLFLDVIGGVLIALTAWFRVQVSVSPLGAAIGVSEDALEPRSGLQWRRRIVVAGGVLLTVGFSLQIWGTWLQLP